MSENNAPAVTATAGQATSPSPPPGHVQVDNQLELAADEFSDDSASDLGSSITSSSTSVSSSIREYRIEHGRTYHTHKDGKYNVPNDETESDRLDLQHNITLMTFNNRLGLSPPNDPDSKVKRVLDVGTGTGIWAIEFGDEHPEAQVIGTDLTPSMPVFVPPNVKFEIADLEEEWTWSQPFDYIHSRFMNASIADWKSYAKKTFDNLTPGGYFEVQEMALHPTSDDGTLKPDCSLSKCLDHLREASVIFGRPFQEIPPLADVLRDVGFTDVKMTVYKWPINSWPRDPKFKELGIWVNENALSGFHAWTIGPLTQVMGWTKEEVEVLLMGVRKDMNNRQIHAYWPFYAIHGRKPTTQESA